jgi:hypothetical protein
MVYDQAKKKGRTVISMENDWKSIFSFDKCRPGFTDAVVSHVPELLNE